MYKVEREKLLKQIKKEILDLKKSPLYAERVKNKVYPVIGEGDHFAKIMFVGEAPGKNEAITGKPFCGTSGKILDELLSSVSIKREKVYITNIVKDRPSMNRDPSPDEIEIYGPFLDRQVEIIQPKVIATLGRFSMVYIMKKFGLDFDIQPISSAHGKSFEAETSYGKVKIIPLYHPAAAIYNQHLKETLIKDFKILKKYE
ncbi:MAG: uracil-DNA glycosylase [Parcubacteria group bacterium]|nr:uracil-DNA glycosylase [Parcubacteria group bacterium]